MANFNVSAVICGLGSYSVKAPAADQYVVDVKSTIPTLTSTGGTQQSALVTTVSINGTPVATYPAATRGSQTICNCALGDVILVAFSSSSAVDAASNVIQSVIAISEGN